MDAKSREWRIGRTHASVAGRLRAIVLARACSSSPGSTQEAFRRLLKRVQPETVTVLLVRPPGSDMTFYIRKAAEEDWRTGSFMLSSFGRIRMYWLSRAVSIELRILLEQPWSLEPSLTASKHLCRLAETSATASASGP